MQGHMNGVSSFAVLTTEIGSRQAVGSEEASLDEHAACVGQRHADRVCQAGGAHAKFHVLGRHLPADQREGAHVDCAAQQPCNSRASGGGARGCTRQGSQAQLR